MKAELPGPAPTATTRPGDRVIRVSRRSQNKTSGFLSVVVSLLHLGRTPGAR